MPNLRLCKYVVPSTTSSANPSFNSPIAELSKLTAGGAHKGMSAPYPDSKRGTFITHTFPCVFDNTIIVAATYPTVSTGSQFEDGWFLSDFYAFNYLLRGSVAN